MTTVNNPPNSRFDRYRCGSAPQLILLSLLLLPSSAASLVEERPLGSSEPSIGDDGRKLLVSYSGARPVQTYMIPLPESELNDSFELVNANNHCPSGTVCDIITMISFTTSVGGVVFWYDHHEDGLENDVTNPTQSTTLIWGDKDPSNGCIEKIRNPSHTCGSGDADEIMAPEAFILENTVTLPRNTNDVYFDGGDFLRSSFPIAVTRAAFPIQPGSAMAGAVEVIEQKNLGFEFRAPAGTDSLKSRSCGWSCTEYGINEHDSFSISELYVMASEEGTIVTYKSVTQSTVLGAGDTLVLKGVTEGAAVTANKPVQVDFITGHNNGDPYEMRWYSLLPTELWYHDYYSPVFETNSYDTKVALFNPGNSDITVTHQDKNGQVNTYTVSANSAERSDSVRADTGSRFFTDPRNPSNFFAMSITDFETSSGGEFRDWGFPLIPKDKLTSQALVGLGYGCTENDCDRVVGSWYSRDSYTFARSFVWITPVDDADLYVDFDGDGNADVGYNPKSMTALKAIRITDSNDQDMTGAIIYASAPGDLSTTVKIAVAWGQDPYSHDQTSGVSEEKSLDMGTVVPPLPEIGANKYTQLLEDKDGDGKVSPEDVLRYTIRVTNTGQVMIPENTFRVVDDFLPLHDNAIYVFGSTKYLHTLSDGSEVQIDISDNGAATRFPIDDDVAPTQDGILNTAPLLVGTVHQIIFDATVRNATTLKGDLIENKGRLFHNSVEKDTFYVRTSIVLSPGISIATTVNGGKSGVQRCPGTEIYSNVQGADVTYCYVITNTGNTFLNNLAFSDSVGSNQAAALSGVSLAPGESIVLNFQTTLQQSATNTGKVTANPSLYDGSDLPALDYVSDADPASVQMLLTHFPTNRPTDAPSVSTRPSILPTDAPSAGPSVPPTALPSARPSSAPSSTPTVGKHGIDGVDQCLHYTNAFSETTLMRHFAFRTHTTECVHAKVYVSEHPITDEEVAAGELGRHWTFMCNATVRGEGSAELTSIEPEDCSPFVAERGTMYYFYTTLTYLDGRKHCPGEAASWEIYDTVAEVWQYDDSICSAALSK